MNLDFQSGNFLLNKSDKSKNYFNIDINGIITRTYRILFTRNTNWNGIFINSVSIQIL